MKKYVENVKKIEICRKCEENIWKIWRKMLKEIREKYERISGRPEPPPAAIGNPQVPPSSPRYSGNIRYKKWRVFFYWILC